MSELLFSTVLLAMMTVITRERIVDDIPVGMPEDDAVAYSRELKDEDRIRYFTRENSPDGNTVSHSLEAGQADYYIIGIPDVQRYRWWPSFGRYLSAIVVVSNDRTVSEMKFFGARGGWP
ncbi:MAG: hypothetical protein WD071_02645 [Pseudohongiella sp.]|uniref:hypothetical protein n=1 Tax=Pseudohongiella sp. TaxID=1979412 RepID=UPI0034A02252